MDMRFQWLPLSIFDVMPLGRKEFVRQVVQSAAYNAVLSVADPHAATMICPMTVESIVASQIILGLVVFSLYPRLVFIMPAK